MHAAGERGYASDMAIASMTLIERRNGPGSTVRHRAAAVVMLVLLAPSAGLAQAPADDSAGQPVADPSAPEAAAPVKARPTPDGKTALIHACVANYPVESRRTGEQGLVLIRLRVAADGTASEFSLVHSSGFERLDHAALDCVSRSGATFAPVRVDGHAVATWQQLGWRWAMGAAPATRPPAPR